MNRQMTIDELIDELQAVIKERDQLKRRQAYLRVRTSRLRIAIEDLKLLQKNQHP